MVLDQYLYGLNVRGKGSDQIRVAFRKNFSRSETSIIDELEKLLEQGIGSFADIEKSLEKYGICKYDIYFSGEYLPNPKKINRLTVKACFNNASFNVVAEVSARLHAIGL